MIFKSYGPGDVVEGWKFALLPTKVKDTAKGSTHIVWLRSYYEKKRMYSGNIEDYWETARYLDKPKSFKEIEEECRRNYENRN